MKQLRRLGVITAATALAGTSALAGAGVAGAQNSLDWRTDSPSAVLIDRETDGDLVVSYDNRSEKNLFCYAYIGPGQLVDDLYDAHVETGLGDDQGQMPPGTDAAIAAAIAQEQWAVGAFIVEAGDTGPVVFGLPEYDEIEETVVWVPSPLEQPADKTFAAEVLTACAFSDETTEWYSYAELETSVTADDGTGDGDGNGGLFGSLSNLIPAFGS